MLRSRCPLRRNYYEFSKPYCRVRGTLRAAPLSDRAVLSRSTDGALASNEQPENSSSSQEAGNPIPEPRQSAPARVQTSVGAPSRPERRNESVSSFAGLRSTKGSEVAGRRRIPANFVKEVLIPHLEQWIYDSRKTYPSHLIELVVAYSQMPVINPSLCATLADMVIYRLEDFNGPELIKMLWPLLRLRPHDTNLFAHIAIELEEHFLELNTLHLIAIVRVFAQLSRNSQQQRFLDELVVPRLQSDIARYDTEELSALLVSLAAVPVLMGTAANVPLLATIVPALESRYDETPLLTSIINVNALCRLRVFHRRLLLLVASDLNDPFRIRNLLPKYISVALWTFARYGLLSRVYPKALHGLICDNLGRFNARDFARLCQALPEESDIPALLAKRFLEELPSMSPDHFTFFVLGCSRRGLFPCDNDQEPIRDARLHQWDTDSTSVDNDAVGLDQQRESSSSEEKYTTNSASFFKLDFAGSSSLDPPEVTISNEQKIPQDPDHQANASSTQNQPIISREKVLSECLEYLETFEDDLSTAEIQRLTRIFFCSPKQQYSFIINKFPSSWETIVHEILYMGK